MNKKIQNFLKVLVVGGTIVALSMPVFATPLLEKIEAFFNPNLTYILDGEEVLEDAKAITYNDTTYISIRELSDALGKEISYDNGVITIRSEVKETKETNEVETPALPESVTIEKAIIKEVDLENNKVTILPADLEDELFNYVTLNINPEATSIHHERNKMLYHLDMLEAGMVVTVKHSPIMTMSIPPQTSAFEIIILAEQN